MSEIKSEIPTTDFFEDYDLNEPSELSKAVNDFIFALKSDYFLRWEAIEKKEQELPLTEAQTEILAVFTEKVSEPIFYINDLARPSEPWYEIARKIVPHFVKDPFLTDTAYHEIVFEGWLILGDALENHAHNLSLPTGVKSHLDIISLNIQHQLNLQLCVDELSGLGREEDITLEDEDQLHRIDEFISVARGYRDSLQYLGVTLEKLVQKVIMPPKDEKIFTDMLMVQLGINSLQENLSKYLNDNNFTVTSFLA